MNANERTLKRELAFKRSSLSSFLDRYSRRRRWRVPLSSLFFSRRRWIYTPRPLSCELVRAFLARAWRRWSNISPPRLLRLTSILDLKALCADLKTTRRGSSEDDSLAAKLWALFAASATHAAALGVEKKNNEGATTRPRLSTISFVLLYSLQL